MRVQTKLEFRGLRDFAKNCRRNLWNSDLELELSDPISNNLSSMNISFLKYRYKPENPWRERLWMNGEVLHTFKWLITDSIRILWMNTINLLNNKFLIILWICDEDIKIRNSNVRYQTSGNKISSYRRRFLLRIGTIELNDHWWIRKGLRWDQKISRKNEEN